MRRYSFQPSPIARKINETDMDYARRVVGISDSLRESDDNSASTIVRRRQMQETVSHFIARYNITPRQAVELGLSNSDLAGLAEAKRLAGLRLAPDRTYTVPRKRAGAFGNPIKR